MSYLLKGFWYTSIAYPFSDSFWEKSEKSRALRACPWQLKMTPLAFPSLNSMGIRFLKIRDIKDSKLFTNIFFTIISKSPEREFGNT